MKVYKLTSASGEIYYPASSTTEKQMENVSNLTHGAYEAIEINEEFICEKLNSFEEKLKEFEDSFSNLRDWLEQGRGLC